jgi:hypothetical protein
MMVTTGRVVLSFFLASQALVLGLDVDPDYPGTAVERMRTAVTQATALQIGETEDWREMRPKILNACGLKSDTQVAPGRGNTGHW